MRNRTTLFLLGALLVLGTIAAIVQGPARRDRPRERGRFLPALKSDEVQAVRITRSGATLRLERAGEGWTVGEARRAAGAAEVRRLLDDLASLDEGTVASTNPAKRGLYEVDAEKGIGVRLEGAGAKVIAAFTVGKPGPDFASSYVQREGEDRVLLVSRDLQEEFSRPESEWRERRIVPLDRDEITAVRVEAGGTSVDLVRGAKGGEWQVNGRPAARAAAEDYLDLVANLRAADFAEPSDQGAAGSAQVTGTVRVEAGPKKVLLTIADAKEGASQRVVRTDRSPDLYLVGAHSAQALLKKAEDFPPPAPPSPAAPSGSAPGP